MNEWARRDPKKEKELERGRENNDCRVGVREKRWYGLIVKRSENEREVARRGDRREVCLRQNVAENANADTVIVAVRLTQGTSYPFGPSSSLSFSLLFSFSFFFLITLESRHNQHNGGLQQRRKRRLLVHRLYSLYGHPVCFPLFVSFGELTHRGSPFSLYLSGSPSVHRQRQPPVRFIQLACLNLSHTLCSL